MPPIMKGAMYFLPVLAEEVRKALTDPAYEKRIIFELATMLLIPHS